MHKEVKRIKNKISNEELVNNFFVKNNILENNSISTLNVNDYFDEVFKEALNCGIIQNSKLDNNKANGVVYLYSPKKSKAYHRSEVSRSENPDDVPFTKCKKLLILDKSNLDSVNFDGLQECYGSCQLYFGKRRKLGLSYVCGFDIDVDDIFRASQLQNVFKAIEAGLFPMPNVILNSGTGLHFYYRFSKPIYVYENWDMQDLLLYAKQGLCIMIERGIFGTKGYHSVVSKLALDQLIRLPDSATKLAVLCDNRHEALCYSTTAYLFRKESYNLDSFIKDIVAKCKEIRKAMREAKIRSIRNKTYRRAMDDLYYFSDCYSRNNIKEKALNTNFVFKSNGKVYTHVKRNLFDSFLNRKPEIEVGHRYFYLLSLVSYAKKGNVSYDELKETLNGVKDYFNEKSEEKVTDEDVSSALKMYYNLDVIGYTSKHIFELCGIKSLKDLRKESGVEKGRPSYQKALFLAFKELQKQGFDLGLLSCRKIVSLLNEAFSKSTVAKYLKLFLRIFKGKKAQIKAFSFESVRKMINYYSFFSKTVRKIGSILLCSLKDRPLGLRPCRLDAQIPDL